MGVASLPLGQFSRPRERMDVFTLCAAEGLCQRHRAPRVALWDSGSWTSPKVLLATFLGVAGQ